MEEIVFMQQGLGGPGYKKNNIATTAKPRLKSSEWGGSTKLVNSETGAKITITGQKDTVTGRQFSYKGKDGTTYLANRIELEDRGYTASSGTQNKRDRSKSEARSLLNSPPFEKGGS